MQRAAATTELSADDFVYYPYGCDTEEPTRYELGGYHPIVIGNTLRCSAGTTSYRIIHKLGHGAFSTVWLAENLDSRPRYVAVKVSTADGMSSSEADDLRSVSSPFIVQALDSFSLEGPNGLHHVLVTEVLVPVLKFATLPHTWRSRKKIILELVKAVKDLHAAGLVHGDLHVGNVGVTFPHAESLNVFDLLHMTKAPDMTAVLLDDASKMTASLPAYITSRCDMKMLFKGAKEKDNNYEPTTKLFDFGSVRRLGEDKDLMCTWLSCAPETRRALALDKDSNPRLEPAVDVWALGTMIFEITTGFHIFEGSYLYPPDTYISQTKSPDNKSRSVTDRSAAENEWWSETVDELRKRNIKGAECDNLVKLLKKIFVLDPSDRPSAAEIAQDNWFNEFLVILPVQFTGDEPGQVYERDLLRGYLKRQ